MTTDPVATSDDTKRMDDWVGGAEFDSTLCSAQGGDEAAFAALWRSLHPPLLRWLSVVAPGGAEDVESEVWVTVSRGLASFEGDERDFRAWLFTTARRRAIDWARRRKREPRAAPLDGLDVADPVATSSSLVDADAALEAALTLLRRLTPDQREIVALRVIVGLTVRETATIVNKSDGAVRVLCHRGLRTLAQHLDADQLARGVTI